MKILHVTNLLPHYRIPVYKLLSQKYDTTFVFYSDGNEYYADKSYNLRSNEFKCEYLRGYTVFPKYRISPKLIWYLLFSEYDILLLSLVGRFSVPMSYFITKFIRRKPIIGWLGMWTHPQSFFHRITFSITKKLYRSLDAMLVYGTHSKKYLEGLGVNSSKIFCAWNSVDNSLFEKEISEKEKLNVRHQFGVTDEEKIILFIGRLEPIKGLEYLIESAEVIEREGLKGKFVIIGRGSESDKLQKIVSDKKIQNVIFVGHIDNEKLPAIYSSATCFVLPSISLKGNKETWGLVCNESMIQGCPVIATDAVGAAVGGLILNGVNGIVIKERNVNELSIAITKIINDDGFRNNLSRNAVKSMKQWNPVFQFTGIENAIEYLTKQ